MHERYLQMKHVSHSQACMDGEKDDQDMHRNVIEQRWDITQLLHYKLVEKLQKDDKRLLYGNLVEKRKRIGMKQNVESKLDEMEHEALRNFEN